MIVKKLNNCPSGVEVSEIDLSVSNLPLFKQIGKLVVENLIVVIRNQKLTCEDELRICKAIGDLEPVDPSFHHICPLDSTGNVYNEIIQVSGLKDADGNPIGVFGDSGIDLDWHANRASAEKERKPFVWLYGVHGTKGSRTSWANCSAAYNDLDSDLKNEISELRGIFGYEPGRYTNSTNFKTHRNYEGIKIVQKIKGTNKVGLYFPFLQLFGFKNKSDAYSEAMIKKLSTHVTQEKYLYHHDWEDGDIVISEQWLTIHKRWACDVSNRMLHRITLDYEKILDENGMLISHY